MSSHFELADALAAAFLARQLMVEEMIDRATQVLGERRRWIRPLAQRVTAAFSDQPRPRKAALTAFLLADHGFLKACRKYHARLVHRLAVRVEMGPVAAAESWSLPPLRTPGELADWLALSISELEWFADLKTLNGKSDRPQLDHYHYRLLTKRFGQLRLVEAPKPRLKQIQRQILAEILDCIPAHDAAHGFRKGRSIVSFAAPHTGQSSVLKLDLHNFFPSISCSRVQAIFRTAGYPERVADLLGGLCTNAAPETLWRSLEAPHERRVREAAWLYAQRHLPQGAPTSPAIANLCAFRLDCRLAGLARSAQAEYTRYADDLAFSGDREFGRTVKRFQTHVSATILDEGFRVHYRKTRAMRPGVCQRLAGLVVNEHLNVPRQDFDRLKAVLTNCIRSGPASQNRDDHPAFRNQLEGHVAFVEMVNPARGQRLRKLFEQIEW